MRHPALRFAILTLSLALVAAACGDDDSSPFAPSGDDGTTATTSTTTTDDDGSATTEGTTETTEDDGAADTTAPPSGDGDGPGDIPELLERYQNSPLRATYLFGQADDEQVIVLSQDPNREPPVSAILILEGTTADSPEEGRILTIGTNTVFCGPPGPDNICFGTPGGDVSATPGGALLGPLFGFLFTTTYTDLPGFTVEEEGATIAGRSGRCFTVRPQAFTGADVEYVRQCVDSELGFSLLIETKDADGETVERVMELIAFGPPQPSDFEPTGQMMEVPGS